MPKLKFQLPSYRRHKVSGQAIVTLNGKDHYLGVWQSESSKVEYERLLGEWMAAGKTLPAASNDFGHVWAVCGRDSDGYINHIRINGLY